MTLFKRWGWMTRLATGMCLAGAACLAVAQTVATWPQRPVRIVIPHPPGGPSDLIARTALERLTATLKQPVVLDNRAGAGAISGPKRLHALPPMVTPGC